MPTSLRLVWNKGPGDAWCDLLTVKLDHPHFNDMEGVYVLWHGGPKPAVLSVGQGVIREQIAALRRDPKVLAFKDQQLFVSWARVDAAQRGGVERYLAELLKPGFVSSLPAAEKIEVNFLIPELTDKTTPAPRPAGSGGQDRPGQDWEELVAPGGPPALEIVSRPTALSSSASAPSPPPTATPEVFPARPARSMSNLQRQFNEVVEAKPTQAKKGFFGGSQPAPKQPEDDRLVVSTVQLILEEAVRNRASDIHIEPMEGKLRVRFRIDGILEEALEIPRSMDIRVISRIRVMCGLDPEQGQNSARPQDGRMIVTVDGRESDLRLSTFPTSYGDKAVLRLIQRAARIPEITQLGLKPETVDKIQLLIHRPQGMIVVTGPSGNGKSTTLYTILQTLNGPERNIVTLEDPIEMKIPGVNQSAVQPRVGFTFSDGLRSILRQDPNIIMVGEIRDTETAEIAASAALTGHLLFTTLHTNSALGAVTRLQDMGLEPYLVASALTAILAQRLARRICPRCREPYHPSPKTIEQLQDLVQRSGAQASVNSITQLYRGKGCDTCRNTGYLGRVLLLELAQMSQPLRQLILHKAPIGELQAAAIKEGMEPLLVDGIHKMAAGLTTMEELIRVVGAPD